MTGAGAGNTSNIQRFGGPAPQALHRTGWSSQLRYAKCGVEGTGDHNAAVWLNAVSTFSHMPKQVLFPPVIKTHHSSGVVLDGFTLDRIVCSQSWSVKMLRVLPPALAAAVGGVWALEGFGIYERNLSR